MSGRRSRARCATARRSVAVAALFASAAMSCATALAAEVSPLPPLQVVGDAIAEPLAGSVGDAGRGRALLLARESANCVLCHAIPEPAARFAGDVGPSLVGIGARMSAAQLRLRVADNLRINPSSVMPSYYKTSGFERVAPQYSGKPILTASQVEDVVAYLATLR